MEEIRKGHRTACLQDVMEIVRNPNSGFDPEPVTISEVGHLVYSYTRYLPKTHRFTELILQSSAKKEESTVTGIITTMQRCSVNHWLPWGCICSM